MTTIFSAEFATVPAFPAASSPNVKLTFPPATISITNEGLIAAAYVEVSFDGGATIAAKLIPGLTQGVIFTSDAGTDMTQIWLRGAQSSTVEIIASSEPLQVYGGGGGGGSGSTNVQGVIAHDEPDNEATNFPVKIGGHATVLSRPDVGEDDIADHSVDLGGRQRVRVSSPGGDASTTNDALFVGGDEAHDAPDAGNPVKIGGRAVASIDTGIVGGVAVGDRTDLAATITGLLGVAAVGTIANDSLDAGNPLKVGGVAVAVPSVGQAVAVASGDRVNQAMSLGGHELSMSMGMQANDAAMLATNNPMNIGGLSQDQAPVLVSAVLDVVQAYLDRAGRPQVNQELSMAGENIALNVLRTVNGLLSVEQESTEQSNPAAVGTLENTRVVRASAGRVYAVSIASTSAVGLWCLVINNTTATGNAIVDRFYIPAMGSAQADYSGWNGIYCDTGMCIAISTTPIAITAPGAAATQIHVNFF